METIRCCAAVLATFIAVAAPTSAQETANLTGDWQGTLPGARPLRLVVHVAQGVGPALTATLSSIDQSPDWGASVPADSIVTNDERVTLAVAALRVTFEGTIAADRNTIVGTWSQGASHTPLMLARATPETAWKDPALHTTQLVDVGGGVQLEVVSWGGPTGGTPRTLVLVPGLGNTAHVFDVLAQKLATRYRVFGITRRGFGASSAPTSGYGADQLGDDVLAVLQKLEIDRPVLAGHSFGGEELSSVGSRYPERVAGLIYLEAAYTYAFAAPGIDPIPAPPPPGAPMPPVVRALMDGMRKYTKIPAPILAIYALPQDPSPTADAARRAANESENLRGEAQARAFEAALPAARVVRFPHANHYVFISNEADVLREMDSFIAALK